MDYFWCQSILCSSWNCSQCGQRSPVEQPFPGPLSADGLVDYGGNQTAASAGLLPWLPAFALRRTVLFDWCDLLYDPETAFYARRLASVRVMRKHLSLLLYFVLHIIILIYNIDIDCRFAGFDHEGAPQTFDCGAPVCFLILFFFDLPAGSSYLTLPCLRRISST